ncbi:MAG: methionyl-tRNA formyltransferase [bacterium]|nr:methionyl-tRNA formyltransferase [bacterium]
MKNKFVFFGTPIFTEIILKRLVASGFSPEVVICNPDRPIGRKKVVTPPPVKQLVVANNWPIKIWQPERLDISSYKLNVGITDFAVVAAYAKIIPKEILNVFRLGVIGVHPSLLPRYRGASPIQSMILSGEAETGVTLYLMDEKMDHGPILEARKWKVENRIYFTQLLRELAELGGEMLVQALPKFLAGEIEPIPQNHEEATFTKKITTEDALISEEELKSALAGDKEMAIRIDRMIRALNPEPGSYTVREGKRIKLLKSEIQGEKLILKEIQEEGKKPREVGE